MPSLAACRPRMAGLLPTTTSTSGAKPATNSSNRIASTFAYKSENQCFMACSLLGGLRRARHLSNGCKRSVDCLEIVALHHLPEFAFLGAVGRRIHQLEREAESQAQIVAVAEDFVDDEAVGISRQAKEDDLFLRVEGDPLSCVFAAEHDVADQSVGGALDHIALRHAGNEGQCVVRLHDQALPNLASAELRLARGIHGNLFGYVNHAAFSSIVPSRPAWPKDGADHMDRIAT